MDRSPPDRRDREVPVTAGTPRERIRAALTDRAMTPSDLAELLQTDVGTVLDHLDHVCRSLASEDARLLVRPPTCRSCGFDGFDRRVNLPSRCPSCRSERIREPAFRIEA